MIKSLKINSNGTFALQFSSQREIVINEPYKNSKKILELDTKEVQKLLRVLEWVL